MSSPETLSLIPSFSLVLTRHGKIGRYEHIGKYDMYVINHSDITFQSVWLATGFPNGEDDSEIGPISANSIHHIQTITREQINSPYIFDFYEKKGEKPYTYMAEILEEDSFRCNRQYIKHLNQEGWVLSLKSIIIDETLFIQNDYPLCTPIISSLNLTNMSDEQLDQVADQFFDRIDKQRKVYNDGGTSIIEKIKTDEIHLCVTNKDTMKTPVISQHKNLFQISSEERKQIGCEMYRKILSTSKRPELEDFGINNDCLDFCKKTDDAFTKASNKILTFIMVVLIICGIILYSLLIRDDSWMDFIYKYGYLVRILVIIPYLFFLVLGLPILVLISVQISESKGMDAFCKKIVQIFNRKLGANLAISAKYKIIEDKYKEALAPFIEEDFRLASLKREEEQEKARRLAIEKKLNIDFWFGLNGYVFEREIEILFQKMGYRTKRTKGSGDGGIDIFLFKGGNKYVVQCKNHKKPVGPNIVRDLYGVLKSENAHKAMLINSGGFTKGVHDFARGKDITLWDIKDILKYKSSY